MAKKIVGKIICACKAASNRLCLKSCLVLGTLRFAQTFKQLLQVFYLLKYKNLRKHKMLLNILEYNKVFRRFFLLLLVLETVFWKV